MLCIEKSRHATKNGDNFSFLLPTNNYKNDFCCVLCVCTSECRCPERVEGCILWRHTGSSELWELNPGPLLEQFKLLTTGHLASPLQTLHLFVLCVLAECATKGSVGQRTPSKNGFFLHARGSNSCCQAWLQSPLPAKPPRQPPSYCSQAPCFNSG